MDFLHVNIQTCHAFNFLRLLNSFDSLICLLQWELLRSEIYLSCSFYSPPSVYFSFILITLNIFPRFFELEPWNTELDRVFGLFMRSNEKRPLMWMNYLKATLFGIIPHFGKYFPALPRQVIITVLVSGMMKGDTNSVHIWKCSRPCSLHILIHNAHFLSQFKCFLNFSSI